MWKFASNCVAGSMGHKNDFLKPKSETLECSDDDGSSTVSREEGLECPICWESFNIVENVPYVLWCGHTLCKNCILGLQWAVVKFPTLPLQLPLFISCPWCNLLSLRLVYKGILKFPRKNYFLLWMVESMNGDRLQSRRITPPTEQHQQPFFPAVRSVQPVHHHNNSRHESPLRKSLVFFLHLTSKFPLVLIFLLIALYAVPASAAILALYVLITALFAIPSFLILYFAYPTLDWLVREIIA